LSDTTTSYEVKCEILADLWVDYKNDAEFVDFFDYNDLGAPLAYAIANSIVPSSDLAKTFIEETFDTFLTTLGIEDTGFDSLADIFIIAQASGL
jgi:hypothetical protein